MDEPSASLSLKEVEHLYESIDRLKELGISIIYVSHRMENCSGWETGLPS